MSLFNRAIELNATQDEVIPYLKSLTATKSNRKNYSALFITGEKGGGKSTLLQKYLQNSDIRIYGYMTVRHRSLGYIETAFQHIYLPQEEIPKDLTVLQDGHLSAEKDYFIIRKEKNLIFDRRAFLRLAKYLSAVEVSKQTPPQLMVWDEVGGEELLVDEFYQILKYWLKHSHEIPQIIIWKKKASEGNLRLSKLSTIELDELNCRREELIRHPAVFLIDLDSGMNFDGQGKDINAEKAKFNNFCENN